MNLKKLLLLAAIAALPLGAAAQIQPRPDFVSMQVVQQEDPIFPFGLKQLGVQNGYVRVAVLIDAKGELTDILDLCHSRKEFYDATERAMKHWKFKPAMHHGEPRGVVTDILFEFEEKGVVITMNLHSTVEILFNRMREDRDCRVASLGSIDRIPVPLNIVSPFAPTTFHGSEKVTVEFYIDETGKVRMPCVFGSADEELATRAVDAVRQWKFEPPTYRGEPVLVRAHQLFNFEVK